MVSGMPGIQSQAHAHLNAWIGVFLRAYYYSYQPLLASNEFVPSKF
jgi:hypothetical protein